MEALLLVAHGSRRKQSNDEVIELVAALREKCSQQYPVVHASFLEISSPLIPDGVRKCVEDRAESITVLPYFLNTGRHVADDIPTIVEECRAEYPHVDIRIASHLGASPLILDLVIKSAQAAV